MLLANGKFFILILHFLLSLRTLMNIYYEFNILKENQIDTVTATKARETKSGQNRWQQIRFSSFDRQNDKRNESEPKNLKMLADSNDIMLMSKYKCLRQAPDKRQLSRLDHLRSLCAQTATASKIKKKKKTKFILTFSTRV